MTTHAYLPGNDNGDHTTKFENLQFSFFLVTTDDSLDSLERFQNSVIKSIGDSRTLYRALV